MSISPQEIRQLAEDAAFCIHHFILRERTDVQFNAARAADYIEQAIETALQKQREG
jgi:hypothetical protein